MIRILRARDRAASPWKNGGGTTAQVAVFPLGSDLGNFGWRVSIAEALHGGPFSLFPGIDRQLALLRGRISLAIAGQGVVDLSADSQPVGFPGDVPVEATVIDGPVTDLNVMTRRDTFTACMTRRRSAGTIDFAPGSVAIALLLGETAMLEGSGRIPLLAGDALTASGDSSQSASLANDVDFFWIEIARRGAPRLAAARRTSGPPQPRISRRNNTIAT